MNVSHFIGNLCFEVELRQAGQTQVVNNTLAVNKKVKGEKKTVFIPVTFWCKTAELISQYCAKGTKLQVTAEFEMQEYHKDGQTVKKPNFVVREMQFLDSPAHSQNNGMQQNNQQGFHRYRQPSRQIDRSQSPGVAASIQVYGGVRIGQRD